MKKSIHEKSQNLWKMWLKIDPRKRYSLHQHKGLPLLAPVEIIDGAS